MDEDLWGVDEGGNWVPVRYRNKECVLLGREEDMAQTMQYWRGHINGMLLEKYAGYWYGNILDVGCNIGMATLQLAVYPRVERVVGVDVFFKAIEAATRYANFSGVEQKVEFRLMDFCADNTLPIHYFDAVVLFHTLEHIYPIDLVKFLLHLTGVTKTGATVLISIPHDHHIGSEAHVSYFTRLDLAQWMQRFNFSVVDLFTHSVYEPDFVEGGTEEILTGLFKKQAL